MNDSAARELPVWCDLNCPHAGFPTSDALDGSGSCRTFVALHCAYLGRIVAKNARCAARREGWATDKKDPVTRTAER